MTNPGRHRWTNRLLVFGVVTLVLLPFDSGRTNGPRLVTIQRLPPEVQQLTDQTWQSFLDVFAGKRGCIGTVELVLVDEVEGGAAEYRRSDRLIRIEIPTTPLRFPESLAHELGHHLEEACSVEQELGSAFRTAIGSPDGVDWRQADRWQDRPTEHFAEAVVALVIGERHTHADLIDLSAAALDVVGAWARTPPR